MRTRLGKWYPFSLLALLILALSLFGLACVCTGGRQDTPTPTRVSVAAPATATRTARPSATATRALPSPTRTRVPSRTPTAQALLPTETLVGPASPTTTLPEKIELVDPELEDLDAAFAALPSGGSFKLSLSEDYVNMLALEYLDGATNLPVDISYIEVNFVPGRVEASAILPLGFFRVEVTATGLWRAVDCKFEAEIIDVEIAGQAAPASLREQIDPLIKQGIEAAAKAPVCFTQVETTDDLLVISGYKE